MTDSTRAEQSKLGHSELKDVIITTAAVSVVVGIVLGLVAATKPVIKGVAIAIGAGSAAGAATYFRMDYRHVDRRNALRATIHDLTAQNTHFSAIATSSPRPRCNCKPNSITPKRNSISLPMLLSGNRPNCKPSLMRRSQPRKCRRYLPHLRPQNCPKTQCSRQPKRRDRVVLMTS
ncbi:MAG: hypothetical protein HC895_03620 [Leptolyngbyaceae cyanobacterium SM1_3_5]|nr:hypothetical protein [Leptolyngbyaceae cyanobacterium SM1_3_5]